MPYYHYTMTHKRVCPKCQKTLERSETDMGGNDGCIRWVAYIVAFPIFLIILLIRHIAYSSPKTIGKTAAGNIVVECKKCHSRVVFVEGGTRLLLTQHDLLKMVMPSINVIQEYNISCDMLPRPENSIEEVLVLEFNNKTDDRKCRIGISVKNSQLFVSLDGKLNTYSPDTFFTMVTTKLL